MRVSREPVEDLAGGNRGSGPRRRAEPGKTDPQAGQGLQRLRGLVIREAVNALPGLRRDSLLQDRQCSGVAVLESLVDRFQGTPFANGYRTAGAVPDL